MKDVRIFVASSKELLPERNALAYFVLAHEDEFAKRGLRVRLSKWEYVDPTMTEERTEDRYLDEMLNCDAVLMLFRHVLGKYTKEEVDKAIAAEIAGTSRIKKHLILFKEGDADESPELAAWRASLAEDTYGTFTDARGLGAYFLRLVEQIAGLPLQDVADAESEKTISAFLAVDDELAVDRDAFADAVLNLNDVLSHRGARVRLRFYDPEQHRDMLDNSEMALVLYQTKCGAFGTSALKESYDRAKEEKNPKRLYVFFRDAAGKPLDADFQTFKDGFAEAFGSSPCRFENVDTLSLNFLFALESVLGDGAGTFVKLDGRTVVADGLEVGDLTKLPMLGKNAGIADLFSRMEDVSKRFVAQREKCDKNPQDDGLYVELLDLSAEKNRLQDQIDRELKMSFNLAKRLAAISIAQVNETIARARAKVEEGDIKGALEILDGASSAFKRRRLLHRAADRAEAEELQIKELKAGAEIEYFRVDAVMAYTAMPFEERFKKAESIYKVLSDDLGAFAEVCTVRNKNDAELMYAGALRKYASLYGRISDSVSPNQILAKVVDIYKKIQERNGPDCTLKRMAILTSLAYHHELNKELSQAEKEYLEILSCAKNYAATHNGNGRWRIAQTLSSLGRLHYLQNTFQAAKSEYTEAMQIYHVLNAKSPGKYDDDIAEVLNGLSCIYAASNDPSKAKECYEQEIAIMRQRVPDHANERHVLAGYLHNYGIFLCNQGDDKVAKDILTESLQLWKLETEKNPVKYDSNYSDTLCQLAVVHNALDENAESLACLNECATIDRRNAKINPDRYLPDLATVTYNLAVLYENDQQELANATYLESIDTWRKIAKTNPSRYEKKLAKVLSGYGDFVEQKQKKIPEAELVYKEALEIRRRWNSLDPGKHLSDVASSLLDLGLLCKRQKRYDEARRYYVELVGARRELSSRNPQRYRGVLADSISTLGDILERQKDYAEAEKMYCEALEIRRNLQKKDSERFLPSVGSSLLDLAALYKRLQRYPESDANYVELIKIRKELASANPNKYGGVLANALHGHADMYKRQGLLPGAEKEFLAALEIRRRLVERDPKKYTSDLVDTLKCLHEIYASTNRGELADKLEVEIKSLSAEG